MKGPFERRTLALPIPGFLMVAVLAGAGAVCAQSSAPPPPPPARLPVDAQVVESLVRSAATFSSMIDSLHLKQTFQQSPESNSPRPAVRNAAVIGAGAGIGAALGSLSGNTKTVMIGAVAGGAGAIIIDEILRHQAAKKAAAAAAAGPDPYSPPALVNRSPDPDPSN